MTKPQAMTYITKVGIAAGALIAVGQIVSWSWEQASKPLHDEIRMERIDRAAADSVLARQFRNYQLQSYIERLDLIDVMATPAGPARDRKFRETRQRWLEEARRP